MSEFENEQLSEMSNEDLEEQISDTEDEITLKPKENDSDDSDVDDENDDEEIDDENNIDDEEEEEEEQDDEEDNAPDYPPPPPPEEESQQITSEINNDYDSDSETDDYDENEFKKLDNELKQDYLLQYHQESNQVLQGHIVTFEYNGMKGSTVRSRGYNVGDKINLRLSISAR